MKRILNVAALTACVGAMLCFVGCGDSPAAAAKETAAAAKESAAAAKESAAVTPEAVAVKFFERIAADDYDGAGKFCTKETAALLALAKAAPKDEDDFSKKLKGAKFEAAECKINGDAATVCLKVTLKSGESETMKDGDAVTLVKQDGAWKVNVKKD